MSTSTRTYHHGDLRAQLLGRAADLIARDGAEAFSLRAIAAELAEAQAKLVPVRNALQG